MLAERRTELIVLDLTDQLRQDLADELLLDVEDVAQLVHEQVTRSSDLSHVSPSFA
jgi:hypothetical protein